MQNETVPDIPTRLQKSLEMIETCIRLQSVNLCELYINGYINIVVGLRSNKTRIEAYLVFTHGSVPGNGFDGMSSSSKGETFKLANGFGTTNVLERKIARSDTGLYQESVLIDVGNNIERTNRTHVFPCNVWLMSSDGIDNLRGHTIQMFQFSNPFFKFHFTLSHREIDFGQVNSGKSFLLYDLTNSINGLIKRSSQIVDCVNGDHREIVGDFSNEFSLDDILPSISISLSDNAKEISGFLIKARDSGFEIIDVFFGPSNRSECAMKFVRDMFKG